MEKFKKIFGRLMTPNPKLPQVINKSRVYNSYVALIEIGVIVFWIIIPGRTNQTSHVTKFVIDSIVNIVAVMYVHVSYKIKYF